MYKIIAGLAAVCALSACSTATTAKDGEKIANEMPEYTTGSIIPRKKPSSSDGVKAVKGEQLEALRQESAVQSR